MLNNEIVQTAVYHTITRWFSDQQNKKLMVSELYIHKNDHKLYRGKET